MCRALLPEDEETIPRAKDLGAIYAQVRPSPLGETFFTAAPGPRVQVQEDIVRRAPVHRRGLGEGPHSLCWAVKHEVPDGCATDCRSVVAHKVPSGGESGGAVVPVFVEPAAQPGAAELGTGLAPATVQRMPAHFMRWPTTFLHAASMTPEPIGSPSARCSSQRFRSRRSLRQATALRHSSTSPPHQHRQLASHRFPSRSSRSTSGVQFAFALLAVLLGKARSWELSLYESWASGCRVRSILFMRVWPPPASPGLQAFPLRCAGVGRDGMAGGVQRRAQQFNGLAEVGCDSLDAAVRWNHDHRQPSRGLELHPHVCGHQCVVASSQGLLVEFAVGLAGQPDPSHTVTRRTGGSNASSAGPTLGETHSSSRILNGA